MSRQTRCRISIAPSRFFMQRLLDHNSIDFGVIGQHLVKIDNQTRYGCRFHNIHTAKSPSDNTCSDLPNLLPCWKNPEQFGEAC